MAVRASGHGFRSRRWRRRWSWVFSEIESTILSNSEHGTLRSSSRTIPDISSNWCYKHYPNTLALVGRSLTNVTIDQGPGSAFVVSARREKMPPQESEGIAEPQGLTATGSAATGVKRTVGLCK